MKRRVAATAATAALAVAGPAVAADRNAGRAGQPRSAKSRVTRVAAASSDEARERLAAIRREEMTNHRRRLAEALAAELPAAAPEGIERGLAVSGADPAPTLARSTGHSEAEIEAAFEAMARRARESRLRA